MKTTKLIIIIVIGAVILGALSFIPFLSKDKNQSINETQTAQVAMVNQENNVESTDNISDFIGKEGSYRCDVSYEDDMSATEGVVFVDGMRFKADFQTTVKELGMSVDTHSIWDGEMVYTWSSLTPTGTKAPATIDAVKGNTFQELESSDIANYSCEETVISGAIFEVPQDIEFQDIQIQ